MLLINPATEQFGGLLSRYVPVGIPVAIGTLAAVLMKEGFKVKVADDEIEKITEENIEGYVEGLDHPLVIGISVLTAQAGRAYDLVAMLKKKYTDCYVILGGIHVTALPDEGVESGADFVVRGEGEVPLVELYRAIREGGDTSQIKGLSFRRADGRIQHNPDGQLIPNIDDIPIFPYEMFKNPKYDMGFITSARGCPYKCSYCSQRLMTGLSYRFKSTARVVQELDLLINTYGQKQIVFYDDNFSFNKPRVIELCESIKKAGLDQKCGFFVQTRADNLYEELMPYLKMANVTGVGFGIETGVQRLADRIVKDETVETHIKATKMAQKWGINVSLFMIFGLPSETHDDRMVSYKLVKKLNIKHTKFNNLIPYPGTKLYNEVKNTGEIRVAPRWSNFNSTLTATRSIFNIEPLPYIPTGTSEWELKRDIFRCNMSFYFTPRTLWSVMMRQKGPGFVLLPPNWHKKPKEVAEMARLAFILGMNLLVTLLPKFMGGAIYYTVTGVLKKLAGKKAWVQTALPEAVDGTKRKISFLRAKVDQVAKLVLEPV